VPITQILARADEVVPAKVERANEAPANAERDIELSDLELEAVLGGLERIHFPDPIDSPDP
jgi:hypothetical protein